MSGVQRWNGTRANLKPKPVIISTVPMSRTARSKFAPFVRSARMLVNSIVPVWE